MRSRPVRTLAVFAVCFAFWWLLSDRHTTVSLALGLASAALVAWFNGAREAFTEVVLASARLAPYVVWLLKEIIVANIQVARVILDPRLPIDPVVLHLRPPFRGDLPLTALGNSITLTPGTITVDVEGGDLVVHALTRQGAAGLEEGAMVRRVAHVWQEGAA